MVFYGMKLGRQSPNLYQKSEESIGELDIGNLFISDTRRKRIGKTRAFYAY